MCHSPGWKVSGRVILSAWTAMGPVAAHSASAAAAVHHDDRRVDACECATDALRQREAVMLRKHANVRRSEGSPTPSPSLSLSQSHRKGMLEVEAGPQFLLCLSRTRKHSPCMLKGDLGVKIEIHKTRHFARAIPRTRKCASIIQTMQVTKTLASDGPICSIRHTVQVYHCFSTLASPCRKDRASAKPV